MSFDSIRDELAKNYKGGQSNSETVQALTDKVSAEEMAEFIVSAFSRGWISPFNLGLDKDGDVI